MLVSEREALRLGRFARVFLVKDNEFSLVVTLSFTAVLDSTGEYLPALYIQFRHTDFLFIKLDVIAISHSLYTLSFSHNSESCLRVFLRQVKTKCRLFCSSVAASSTSSRFRTPRIVVVCLWDEWKVITWSRIITNSFIGWSSRGWGVEPGSHFQQPSVAKVATA